MVFQYKITISLIILSEDRGLYRVKGALVFRFTKIIGALVGAPGNLGKEDMVQGATSRTRSAIERSSQAKSEVNEKYREMVERYNAKFSPGGKCEPRILNRLDHKEERIAKDIEYLDKMKSQVDSALERFELKTDQKDDSKDQNKE